MRIFLLLSLLIIRIPAEAQSFVVSADKMNVAYAGIPNPITIVVENYKANQVIVSTDNGTLVSKGNGKYDYIPLKFGKSMFRISVKTQAGIKDIGEISYRIKDIPMPIAVMSKQGKNPGYIDYRPGLIAKSSVEGIDVEFSIVSFDINLVRNNAILYSTTSEGCRFGSGASKIFVEYQTGDKVLCSNILCKYPNGKIRKIEDLIIGVN